MCEILSIFGKYPCPRFMLFIEVETLHGFHFESIVLHAEQYSCYYAYINDLYL